MAFPPFLSSPFSDRTGSRGTLPMRPTLVGRVSYPTSSTSGRVVTIGGNFVSATGAFPPVSTLSGRRGFPSGRPLGLLAPSTDLHNHGDSCHCVLCSPMRGSLRVDLGGDEPSPPGGSSRFSFLPSSGLASPGRPVDLRDVDHLSVSIPSSPSSCASENSALLFFSPASSPLALEVDGVSELAAFASNSSLPGVIRSDYAQPQLSSNGSDYAHSITHVTCNTETDSQDCDSFIENISDNNERTPTNVVRSLLSEFDLIVVDRDRDVVRHLDFDSILLDGDQTSSAANVEELASAGVASSGQIQRDDSQRDALVSCALSLDNSPNASLRSPPSTTITESFPALIACKFSSSIDTSGLLQSNSAFSILFNSNQFDCYRKVLSHFRALSEHAFFILDHVLPQSGPVYSKDLGILLSYVIFIFDMKMLKLPSLIVNSYDGYSFLHFADLDDTDAYEVIATLLTFDGFVGADLGGVNPIAMIQTAASVGAANIAANDASVAYRSTLEALTPVSTILNENDMAHIKRERAVNFKQNNVVSNDHPLMAAYREIIRDDYRKMINLQTTNLRTLVLGATSREYSAYQSNKFICFQLANREGKDTDRMVMDFLKDIRAKNKKKSTCNSRSINSLARKKNELVSVDQMIEMWKKNRVLPSRFLTWEQSQSLIEHGLVNDKIESNPDVEAAILATHVDSRGTFEVIRDIFNDKLLTLIKKRTKDSECSFDQIVFEDVGYNFSEYDWYKIMSNTGATVAYGYMCLPWQLVFPDMCPPPGYVYRESGGYSYFAYEGFSNGYVHKTKYWGTFMRKPVINVKGRCYGIEIVSRAGPMACVKIYATDNPEKFTRNLSLPKYLQTVRLLDVRRSVDRRTNTIDMNGLVYFPVRLEEYLEALNYSLDLSRESLSPRNIMLYARRRVAGLSLVTKQIAHTWTIDAANIPDFAHDVYLVALYTLLVFDSACDQFRSMDDSAVRRFVMRSAATLGYPLKKLFQLFQRSQDFLKYIVKDTNNSSWQDEMGYGSTRMLNSKLFVGTNPEDKLDPSYSIDEEADEDNSPCLFCAELQMFCGTQKFTCTRAIDEDFDFELGLNSEQLRNLRSSLSATDNDPVGLKQVKEEALKNVPPAEFSTPVKIQYLCGPPGTGKSHLIRAIATKKDLVLAPYSRLREDYTNFTHPVTGVRCSLKFATQHSGMSSLNHGRVFVDEYTAFPYECLAVIAFRCAAKEVILVGDHRQPSIIDTVEGLAITKQIPLARIRKHELIKNYRNPADTVSVLNSLYAYNMEATNTRRGYSFDTVDNYHNYSSMTPLFFRHQTAERFGVSRGFNEKVTVRANQGATYDDVALVVTNSDADLLRMPSLAIVALSRHRNRCVILHENNDEAAVFAGMIRGGINQPPPPPPRDDSSSNDSDSDDDGPDVAPVVVRNTVGRTVRIMPNDRVQHIEPTEEPVDVTIESIRVAANQNVVNNQNNNERTNNERTNTDITRTDDGYVQPEQPQTNVGTDVDEVDPDMPELETDSDIDDGEIPVTTGASRNITRPIQTIVPGTSTTNNSLLASSDINTSRGLSLSIPGVSNETQTNSIILRELFNYNSNMRNYSVNTGRDVALVSGVGSILIDDVDQSENEVLNNEPSLSITTTLGDSNVRIPVPSENTCLIRTISEITGRTMEEIWVDLVSCVGGNITERVSTVGLSTSDLESYMNRIQRRCRLIRSSTDGRDDQVYTIGSSGEFIGTIRFSGPPNLGHFENIQNPTGQVPTSENNTNESNASDTTTNNVGTHRNSSGVDNQNTTRVNTPVVTPTIVPNVETAPQPTVQTPQQAVLEMLNNMYTSYSQSISTSTSTAANITTSFGNRNNRMGVSNQVVVTSEPDRSVIRTPPNWLTVPPVLNTIPTANPTGHNVRQATISATESINNAYMQTAYTNDGTPYYVPTANLVNQPNTGGTNIGGNNNMSGVSSGNSRNRTMLNPVRGHRPQSWAGVVNSGGHRGRGRGHRGHSHNRGGRSGPNINNTSFDPNQSVSRPHGPEAFNNLLVAPYSDPNLLVSAVRYVLNAYLPPTNSPQVGETRRHIAQLLLASELGLIQLQRLAQLLNSVYFSFHSGNDSPHCIMTMEQLNSHLCTINLIIASRSGGFSLRYLGSTGIVVTTQPPVGDIGDTNYVEQYTTGSGRQQQNSLLLTLEAIDQIIGVGINTNTGGTEQDVQQPAQVESANTEQAVENQSIVNAHYIPNIQVDTNLVYPGLQGRVSQQIAVVINNDVLNTIESMRTSNNRSNQLTTININEAISALYNMFDDFGQEINYLETDNLDTTNRLSFSTRINLSARRYWLNWFVNTFGSNMFDQNRTNIVNSDDDDHNDVQRRGNNDNVHISQQSQSNTSRNLNTEAITHQNIGSPVNSGSNNNQSSFSREVPDYTGGAEINVVPLSKRFVVEPLEIDYEPYGDQDVEFTAYARHFLDPVKVTTRLVVVNMHPREAIVPLELASYDAFRMLKTEFATMDEDDFTLTNQESLDYIESEFGCGVFDTTKLDNLNPRGHPKSLQEKAWSLLAVSPGVTYFKSNLSQSLSCLQSRYLTKKMVATFNHESIDKANEIADLFCYEHMSINYDIFNDEDLYTTMIESEKAMKQKDYDKQVKFEIGGDGDVRFNMKDIFKPFKTNINLFKAGQGISAWSRDNQTIFQTPFRVINKHFINCLKPHVVYDNGIDELTMMNRVNALFSLLPMSCLNGVIDATACDSGQNRFTQRIERRILERLGISDEFLNWYYSLRESYTLKGYGVTAKIKDIKTSGEPATLLNNTILMACLMNYLIRGQGPSVIVIKGDDGLKRQACIKYDDVARNSLKRFLKMEFKVDIDVPITFCGYFLHDRFLIPDIVRKVFKIIGHRFRNYEHFAEYQKSLRDWILASNKLGINDMCHITSKAYNITHTYCYELFFAIVSLSHISRRQFEREFTLRTYDFNQRYYISPKWSQKTPWYSGDN